MQLLVVLLRAKKTSFFANSSIEGNNRIELLNRFKKVIKLPNIKNQAKPFLDQTY